MATGERPALNKRFDAHHEVDERKESDGLNRHPLPRPWQPPARPAGRFGSRCDSYVRNGAPDPKWNPRPIDLVRAAVLEAFRLIVPALRFVRSANDTCGDLTYSHRQ
jgi:hypothetical protein